MIWAKNYKFTDIVFLLLIFFMLTSTLVTVSAIDVLLPKAGGNSR